MRFQDRPAGHAGAVALAAAALVLLASTEAAAQSTQLGTVCVEGETVLVDLDNDESGQTYEPCNGFVCAGGVCALFVGGPPEGYIYPGVTLVDPGTRLPVESGCSLLLCLTGTMIEAMPCPEQSRYCPVPSQEDFAHAPMCVLEEEPFVCAPPADLPGDQASDVYTTLRMLEWIPGRCVLAPSGAMPPCAADGDADADAEQDADVDLDLDADADRDRPPPPATVALTGGGPWSCGCATTQGRGFRAVVSALTGLSSLFARGLVP